MRNKREDFDVLVLAAVAEIPIGKVASYGQIATIIGYPKHARHVGKACKHSGYYGDFPCHRVVNRQGRLVPEWPEQKALLIREGIQFLDNGNVDMKQFQWNEKGSG